MLTNTIYIAVVSHQFTNVPSLRFGNQTNLISSAKVVFYCYTTKF
nr:MAG TPA: hypothetical protein [Caudoviricetes sp.]